MGLNRILIFFSETWGEKMAGEYGPDDEEMTQRDKEIYL